MSFVEKLLSLARRNRSLLCIGLDPDPELMPQVGIYDFNRAIIDATSDLVCAYKPNFAFYEALGIEGLTALEKTVDYIAQRVLTIADAKRGDIGNTSRAYAKALFETFGFDAATVNPYMGHDSLAPFLDYADRGVFILCRTSNAGAADFQERYFLESDPTRSSRPLFQLVGERAKEWNVHGNVGLVVGANHPEVLKQMRAVCPEMPFLIPGIGVQGGDLAAAVRSGVDNRGEKAIFSSSRQVLYASREKDFAQAARRVALGLRDEINQHLATI